jgi:L-malate glycosyltransferase
LKSVLRFDTNALTRRRTKVVYLVGTLEIGGTERQVVALATGLDPEKYKAVVCCLSRGGPLEAELSARGVPVEIIGMRLRHGLRGLLGFFRLLSFMARERPAIAHGFLYLPYVVGAFVARLLGYPVFVASRRSLGNYKQGRWYYIFAERIANGLTDLIIANSEAVRRDVIRQEKPPPKKVIVIHNGVRAHVDSDAGRHKTRERLNLGRRTTVGVVANLIPYKGHSVFLEAWRTVIQQMPESVAIFVGEGRARTDIERQIRELGLSESVHLVGTRLDMDELLDAIDLVVHPSLEEGFSNAILEAMAAGKPVIATDVGGNPEAVIDGVTGLLVPPGDAVALASAITTLLGDPVGRSAFGLSGRERANEVFGMPAMVRRYEQIYDSLLASRVDGRARLE